MEHVSKIPVDSPQIGRDYIRRCLMRKTNTVPSTKMVHDAA